MHLLDFCIYLCYTVIMLNTKAEVIMGNKINIRGVYFDDISPSEALDICRDILSHEGKTPKVIHTPNSEAVQLCIEQNEYYDIINSADITVADGAGVILASKILKTPLEKGKVAGIDLLKGIAEISCEYKAGIYLLGSRPGIAEEAAEKLKEKYPDIIISGCHDGYFNRNNSENDAVIEDINSSGASVLAVCLGVPAQEIWMHENRDKLNVKLMGGFGGSLDVFAGKVKRAPEIFIKLQLEWLYRLIKEPSRFVRMLKLPKFIFGTIFRKKK